MAAGLSIHPRTLRRRAPQMTYGQIVTEVRMKLALEYQRSTRTTNEEIARIDSSAVAGFQHTTPGRHQQKPSGIRGG
jgi:hypothetical protein